MVSPKRNLIRGKKAGMPEQFDPKRFKLIDKALDYGIEEAKRIKEWPALEEAVDAKIEEQFKFVAWWGANITDKGGRPRKTGNGSVTSFLSEREAKKLTGIGKQQKLRIGTRLANPDRYRDYLLGAEYLAAHLADPDNFRALGTGNNEWYTPAKYIEMARSVLGEIDLDPASSEVAQKTVQAKEFFRFISETDNGLTRPWHGRVWLNPPYAAKDIRAFASKLCEEVAAKNVLAAVMLTHNYTDSDWFQKAGPRAEAICFSEERVKFEDQDGVACAPTQGQAFFYFGDNASKFIEVFSVLGFIAKGITA